MTPDVFAASLCDSFPMFTKIKNHVMNLVLNLRLSGLESFSLENTFFFLCELCAPPLQIYTSSVVFRSTGHEDDTSLEVVGENK